MAAVKIGVIGVGAMGCAHAACLLSGSVENAELGALCDIDPERLKDCRQRFPGIPCFEDFQALLNSRTVDAVLVAVPHPLHTAIASAAFKQGYHTLVEKPLDIAVSQAQILCKAAEESGKVFAIMFNQRTNPLFRRCREIVQGGQLGELKRSVWIITNWYRTQHYYNSGSWRATWAGEGGGVLLNQAPHNLDLWQWICGMPISLTAFCDRAKYHHIEVEDEATLFARYKNGATGMFITSTGEYPGTNRLEISGTLGKLVLENGLLKWWKLQEPEDHVRFNSAVSFAQIPLDYMEITPEEKETSHRGIIQNFANAILNGEKLIAPGEEGIHELTISNAAYLSQWTGNTAVDLPFDTALFDEKLKSLQATSSYTPGHNRSNADGTYSKRWQVNW